jgi:hypothetical protein
MDENTLLRGLASEAYDMFQDMWRKPKGCYW